MTERLNTTNATAVSATFSPAGDFTVQAQIDPKSAAKVVVEAQADSAAPFVEIGTITRQTNPPMLRFAKAPVVRISALGNDGGFTLKAWSGE